MSNTTTQNLGVVTAYGYAKSKGYSGTEEQFAQELAALGNYTNLLAIAYSASSTYAVGDFCLYNSKLYRCVSTIYIAEAWNSSHWEEVTVGSEIKRLDERINSAHQEMYQFGITESVSGNLVHFTDGANSLPFKSISIPLSPVQSGTGDPSPSNVRPITGHDSVTITRTGANLWANTKAKNGKMLAFPWCVTVAGVQNNAGNPERTLKVTAGTTYYVRVETGALSSNWGVYGATSFSSSQITHSANNATTTPRYFSYTPSSDGYWIFWIYKGTNWTDDEMADVKVQITTEYHEEYVEYQADTYPVSFSSAGTVYGGTVDVVSGELVVDTAYSSLSAIAMSGTGLSNGVRRFYSSKLTEQIGVVACDSLIASDSYVYSQVGYISFTAENRLVVTPSWAQSLTTVADYNTALASNPVNLVFKLATPQTYQLSPAEVETLLGTNNVWNDVGTMSVEYPADIKLYIDSRLQS